MKLEFIKFNKDGFINSPFEMTVIFGYEDSEYIQGRLIRDIDGSLIVDLYDWVNYTYKTVSNEELDRIKMYCVVD